MTTTMMMMKKRSILATDLMVQIVGSQPANHHGEKLPVDRDTGEIRFWISGRAARVRRTVGIAGRPQQLDDGVEVGIVRQALGSSATANPAAAAAAAHVPGRRGTSQNEYKNLPMIGNDLHNDNNDNDNNLPMIGDHHSLADDARDSGVDDHQHDAVEIKRLCQQL